VTIVRAVDKEQSGDPDQLNGFQDKPLKQLNDPMTTPLRLAEARC